MRRSSRASGQPLRAEDLGPLVEGQVGGDQDRPPLVSLADDLEEELRAGLGEWDEAKLVDDEQLDPCQLLPEVEQPSLVPGLFSSWTSEVVVVKPTDSPLWQAASPRSRAPDKTCGGQLQIGKL